MVKCESCGRVIPDNAAVCPNCGAATSASLPRAQIPHYAPPQQNYSYEPQQGYMPPPQQNYGSGSQQGYMGSPPQQNYSYGPQQGYMPPPQQNYGYAPQQGYPAQPYQSGVNVTVVNNASKNSTPVLVEVLMSLFLGIYGVGWLMAGETTPGIILLICSFVVYWPLIILLAVITLGLGLLCEVPLAIGAIILNAVLLNNALKRKAAQITMVQTR